MSVVFKTTPLTVREYFLVQRLSDAKDRLDLEAVLELLMLRSNKVLTMSGLLETTIEDVHVLVTEMITAFPGDTTTDLDQPEWEVRDSFLKSWLKKDV